MLHLHRADRADRLADALAGLLARPLADPFTAELVSVPTRGMERWLSQRLSATLGASAGRRDGVCAGIEFPAPAELLGGALAAASGVDPASDPWRPEHVVWTLLETVERSAAEPWLAPLARHLGLPDGDEIRRGRRLSVVRHLAELFHRYGRHRPELITAWAAGRDEDGTGAPLPERLRWQSELWRALRERVGSPSPAERLGPAAERLRAEPSVLALPERLAAFGLTRIATSDLMLIAALAAAREVHLFLLHPSPALWDAVAAEAHPGRPRRRDDQSARLARHPLLRSWGRDARELELRLDPRDAAEHLYELDRPAGSLLGRLQGDIVADRPPPGAPLAAGPDERIELDPADRSVQVHACHGRTRQVEVLRDAILALLAADPTLEPRDVIVMCPDIEAYAPLVEAVFGQADAGEGNDLHVRLADRSLRQTNPVLGAVAALLDLAGSRLTASDVLDFADREPVRRRFRLDDDALAQLASWIRGTGIRWGLDAAQREPFRVPLPEGTWRAGLDRVLVGVALDEREGQRFADVLPLDGIEDIDLAGTFAEFVDRLAAAVQGCTRAQPLADWVQTLAGAAGALTATRPSESWQPAELRRMLDGLAGEAGSGSETLLTRAEVRALLADRLAARPTRANFRTGHLTVCTMYPMRSVPHRVVCLLGLDDGVFPRKAPHDGDDVLVAGPLVGERDPRSEDRQLLLDALLATRERLVITFTGRDERTNQPRPPAVPLGELLDTIDATVRRPDGRPARTGVIVRHPLQPFDRRNFAPGALVPGGPWSFDRQAFAGAQALSRGERLEPPPFLAFPLPRERSPVLALEDLIRFVCAPARQFLLSRLGVRLSQPQDELLDALPLELDHLEQWSVGQRLLDALLAGIEPEAAFRAERARGLLPPGRLAQRFLNDQLQLALTLYERTEALVPGARPSPVDVHVRLPDGRLLSGTAGSTRGDLLVQATFSRVRARQRLAAWVRLLGATAEEPERALRAITIGRGRTRGTICWVEISPLAADAAARRESALAELARLADLYDRGMCEPLPLPCQTAAAWALARHRGEDPVAAAGEQWTSEMRNDVWWSREDEEPEHTLDGRRRSLEELLGEAPATDERGAGWAEDEPSRFGRLARRLWDPLLGLEAGAQ